MPGKSGPLSGQCMQRNAGHAKQVLHQTLQAAQFAFHVRQDRFQAARQVLSAGFVVLARMHQGEAPVHVQSALLVLPAHLWAASIA